MEFIEKQAVLSKRDPNILMADGFEGALIGYLERFDKNPVAVYDRQKCIDILVDRDDMSESEAEEFFEFNVDGSWVGKYTPLYITIERPE